jgi:protocatechuate 3,4-dioxygenase beta subunit
MALMRGRSWQALTCALMLQLTALDAQVPELAPEGAPSTGEIASAAEPGARLVIAGRVLDAATRKPVPNASLYLYHTDAKGYYTPDAANDNRNPRLRAHLRTNTAGAFEARTIRPAPYPQGSIPAHVHMVVQAPGFARRNCEIVFTDDPNVNERIRREAADPHSFYILLAPPSQENGFRVAPDILLRRE